MSGSKRSVLTRLCLLLLLCWVRLHPSQSSDSDTLSQGRSLKDGQILISSNSTFALGFFSPGNSSNRYVAIWYHGITPLTIIWVANRDQPLLDYSGSFGISAVDGSLVVRDGRGKPTWSSNSSSSTNTSTLVQLLDSGNLVLHDNGGAVRWQSFDNPTDTFLPGMKILMDYETGKSQLFTSWKSADDPGTGMFSIGLDPRGSTQIFMWENGTVPRWRSGQWNGQAFIGTRMRPLFVYGFKLSADDAGRKRYFTFSTFNNSLYRFALQPEGVENATILIPGLRKWGPIWSEPTAPCELYNHCGNNSVCNDQWGATTCSCLVGYTMGEGGVCERKSKGRCEGGNGQDEVFEKVGGLKLPDMAEWASITGDPASCAELCERNCSCRAYAFADGIGCMVWASDLVDIHQSYGFNTNDLYVKVSSSDVAEGKSKSWVVPVVTSLLGFLLFVFITSLLYWKCRSRLQVFMCKGEIRKKPDSSFTNLDLESIDISCGSDTGYSGKSSDLPVYQFETIAAATQYFSVSNKLGQGGFGDVYKGVLPRGHEIAVKRLSKSSGQGLGEFKNEAILIAKLQHRNLVRLLGCCVDNEEKILIYEYMPNKSLDAFLFDDKKRTLLDWDKRFSIIEGVAKGLLYLHQDSRLRIVHRDLKASNILLDEKMSPKISDFGMARIFGTDQNQDSTNRVVGTFGYMSPEYAMEGLFSVKSDVYSFGILILEIISGRRNNSLSKSEHGSNLVGYAWKLWNEDRAMELADKAMGNSISFDEVLRCIHVALLCVQDKAVERPIMSSVVIMLRSESAAPAMPRQPTYTMEGGGPSNADSLIPSEDTFTNSDVSMTRIDVR